MKKIYASLVLIFGTSCWAQSDNVLYPLVCGSSSPPSWCKGSDLGAWINAAATSNRGARLIIPGSTTCRKFTTPIVVPAGTNIWGDSKDWTCIQYVSTNPPAQPTGTAITYRGGGASGSVAGYGLRDLHLAGPGTGFDT